MILVSTCNCLCPIYWSQVLSREWRCSWSSADRRCSNYIWVINKFMTPPSCGLQTLENSFNSLSPGRFGSNLRLVIFKLIYSAFPVKLLSGECHKISTTLVQVMADGTKPIPEPILVSQWVPKLLFCIMSLKITLLNYCHISQRPMI